MYEIFARVSDLFGSRVADTTAACYMLLRVMPVQRLGYFQWMLCGSRTLSLDVMLQPFRMLCCSRASKMSTTERNHKGPQRGTTEKNAAEKLELHAICRIERLLQVMAKTRNNLYGCDAAAVRAK